MTFLSNLVKKPVFVGENKFATLIDFGLPAQLQSPEISTVLLKNKEGKFAVPINQTQYIEGKMYLNKNYTSIPYNPSDFYLVEDLLDKQVIDITGKRMVRVNDVLLKENGGLKVIGIDISFAGVLRRLGLGDLNPFKAITLPWAAVEAFDYETGDIRIKLGKSNLKLLHPAEIADILEDAGTKEREGIVEALDAEKAADAIEEANSETQEALLEQLPAEQLKKILAQMKSSEIADIIDDINSESFKRIIKLLSSEKAQRVKKLMLFPDDVAGGLMQIAFFKINGKKTIKETLEELAKLAVKPEAIIVLDDENKFIGQIPATELLNADPATEMKKIVTIQLAVRETESFSGVLRQFAHYNLRVLPVVDNDNMVVGVISVDAIIQRIEEEEQEERNVPL